MSDDKERKEINKEFNLRFVLWTARVFNAVLFLQIIVCYCFVTINLEGTVDLMAPFRAFTGEAIAALLLTLSGTIVAWKNEKLAGVLILAGLVLFNLANYLDHGSFECTSLVWSPGALFLLHGFAAEIGSHAQKTLTHEQVELVGA